MRATFIRLIELQGLLHSFLPQGKGHKKVFVGLFTGVQKGHVVGWIRSKDEKFIFIEFVVRVWWLGPWVRDRKTGQLILILKMQPV